MRYLRELNKSDLKNKTCLLRVNLDEKKLDRRDLRIQAAIPTIKFLLKNGSTIKILSHRGRPDKEDPNLSLEPVINILSKEAGKKLDYIENTRFFPGEIKNSKTLAKDFAQGADFYVNDDFATSHRSHSSIVAITEYLPSFAGLLLEREIKTLAKVRDNPKKPLVLVIGGIKIEDKIAVINNFKNKADYFLMGSAYLKNDNKNLKARNILLPEDWVEDHLDIGLKTIKNYNQIISKAKTIIWNGPLGNFENKKYINGSKQIAQSISKSGAFSVVGGGDTGELIRRLNMQNRFSFISTGGGAMIEFLAGRKLPGIEALNKVKG